MTCRKAEMLLATVIIARATSLLIIKISLGGFETFNLMALRFGIAFVCILPFVRKKRQYLSLETVLHGVILGVLFFAMIAFELAGLRLTDSSAEVAFIENTAIVLVPLAEAMLVKRLPERQAVSCALISVAGVGFLLLQGGSLALNAGMIFCITTAILYTAYIIVTDRVAGRDEPVVLGAIILITGAVISSAATLVYEQPRLPASAGEWTGMLVLAVVCGSIGTALQPLAQKYVKSEKACLFCALNPLTTCVLGWIFLSEWQGISGMIGAALILAAIIIPGINEHLTRCPAELS